jgi:ADP-heptose:LPS heptosyltransferase
MKTKNRPKQRKADVELGFRTYVENSRRFRDHTLAEQQRQGKPVDTQAAKLGPGMPNMGQQSYIAPNRVLQNRPPGAPSIFDERPTPIKLIVSQWQSPGDIVMVTSAVRDLHDSYPGKFITDIRGPCGALWEASPYITKLNEKAGDVVILKGEYELINTSNDGAHHFIHGFRKDFENKLGIPIKQGKLCGDIHLSNAEKSWYSQIREMTGKDIPFWIIDAGCKSDFTCKLWDLAKYQEVVDSLPEVTFVQIGAKDEGHRHAPLSGDNVIDLIGKTDQRQLVRLVYHSAGMITPVSFPMHLAAGIEMHPRYRRQTRPCIVLAGGREPSVWEMYTNHAYLHTCGMLPCCDNGGCWASRIEPIGDGDEKDSINLCRYPVTSESGQLLPKCMDMIEASEVINAVRKYNLMYDYVDEDPAKWSYDPEIRTEGKV